ncbi:MAG: hypothetical protein U0807_02595 [Candidatus Binatia bacterium]
MALAATIPAYKGTKVGQASRPPCRATISHGLRAFRNAAHGVSPAANPRIPSCQITARGSTSAPNPAARAPRQKSTSS